MMNDLPPLFKLEHEKNSIIFNDCKSGSIEVITKSHHVYQIPDYFFDLLDAAYDIDSILSWLSEMDESTREHRVRELNAFADDLEIKCSIYISDEGVV